MFEPYFCSWRRKGKILFGPFLPAIVEQFMKLLPTYHTTLYFQPPKRTSAEQHNTLIVTFNLFQCLRELWRPDAMFDGPLTDLRRLARKWTEFLGLCGTNAHICMRADGTLPYC
ncbi:hypothetical protein J6590_048599 [Homalodisca vitripennis]|nr:hypothetical protein J6590_048599 [Homalodisca vitripennis]